MTSDSTPAFEIEKEALKTEIETGIQAGVDHLEAKTAKRKDADKYHNTRHLLKQYRKVAYAIQISEADMNVRMEMEHGTRLSTLEVNAELAGVDLSGSKLEGYSAVATYSGSASSTVATGYITTAEYKGTVVSSGISSILYTVTYLGTKIEPTKAEPTFKGAVLVISIIGGTALLAALLFLGLALRKNTTVYKATGKGNEYEKCGRLHLKAKNPELRIDRLKDIPEGVIAIEVDQAVAKKLFGQTIAIRCYDNTVEHTVGEVNGSYWFKVDIGSQEGESNYEEEP